MTRFASFRISGPLAVFALFWACADVGPEVDGLAVEVARQRQIWASRRPDTYVFELERQCFCAEEGRGPVRLVVDGNRVVSRVYTDSGEAVPDRYADLFPTVDGLFDVLQDALQRPADHVDVAWDPDTGAPLSFFIDYARGLADEEVGFRIVTGPS